MLYHILFGVRKKISYITSFYELRTPDSKSYFQELTKPNTTSEKNILYYIFLGVKNTR